MARDDRQPCERKRRFRDLEEAQYALRMIKAGSTRDRVPQRAYACEFEDGGCGGAHLTSQRR